MIVIDERKLCSPISEMSMPSIFIVPSAASIIRNRAKVKEDLPAPVRPTIPTLIIRNVDRNLSLKKNYKEIYNNQLVEISLRNS